MQKIGSNAYEQSSLIPILQKSGTLVLTDQDGTNTVNSSHVDSPQELEDRAATAALMKEKGVVTGTVSARTLGLTISKRSYLSSLKHGFNEPEPRWGKDRHGRHVYVDPATVSFFRDSLDRHISACLGSGIILKNGHGYRVDWEYDELLNYDHVRGTSQEKSKEPWRRVLLAFLVMKYPLIEKNLSPLEFRSNYEKGITNVAPPRYRVQLNYEGQEGLERMRELQRLIRDEATNGNMLCQRIAAVDESHPNLKESDKSRYTLYLMPWGAQKERMVNWVVDRAARAAGKETRDCRLFYAGDTLTDLRAGLYGGGEAETTFLLATGSRVAPYILGRREMFGNESLDFLWSSARRRADRLRPTGTKGVYTFNIPGGFKKPNRVVIGDERYPGMTPPGSVHAFLKEFL